jgi:hypothetical protein
MVAMPVSRRQEAGLGVGERNDVLRKRATAIEELAREVGPRGQYPPNQFFEEEG